MDKACVEQRPVDCFYGGAIGMRRFVLLDPDFGGRTHSC